MNIYMIAQRVNDGWDTYDSAIVAAENEDVARFMHPDGDPEPWDFDSWCDPTDVTVTPIGISTENLERVILSSFNDG